MDHILPCIPQGGSIYPTGYNTKVYIGGIYVIIHVLLIRCKEA